MFSYYGSKSKIIDYYPPPKYGKIIEPFAGSARYSFKYWRNDVLLVDKYDVIIKIWHYLQNATENEILKLYEPKLGETINIDDYDCEGSFLLMNYVIKSGGTAPSCTVCKNRGGVEILNIKKTIAKQLFKIRHWKIIQGDYKDLKNEECTWFIDAPYMFGGEHYKESNKNIDFELLSEWCKSRKGQVMVCENTKADWLPFIPLVKIQGTAQINTMEALWTNYKLLRQQKLF